MGEIDSNSVNGIKIENDDNVSKSLALQEKGKRSDDQGGVGSQRRVCVCVREMLMSQWCTEGSRQEGVLVGTAEKVAC